MLILLHLPNAHASDGLTDSSVCRGCYSSLPSPSDLTYDLDSPINQSYGEARRTDKVALQVEIYLKCLIRLQASLLSSVTNEIGQPKIRILEALVDQAAQEMQMDSVSPTRVAG